MALHLGIVSSGFSALPPTASIGSTNNFNQELATFNATISANGGSTTVVFEYSTASNFSSYTTVTATGSPVTGDNVAVYYNVSGLSTNTTYYVRCRATNAGGQALTGNTSFTTWNIQVYERTTSGGTTFTIPTVTPTGNSAQTVNIYDIIMFGGGGGGYSGGGGGGAYVSQTSAALTGARSITTSVGGGGGAATTPNNGGNTTISGDITTLTANGGSGNQTNSVGATSGNGYTGGTGAIYNGNVGSSKGIDSTNDGYGGGGGAGGNGGNATANVNGGYGGNGGIGVSITRGGVTIQGGAGGGGGAYATESGGSYAGSVGTYNTYGAGGQGGGAFAAGGGGTGYIRFRYYAASALA